MLLLDCFLYAFLAIYLDQVIPGEFGPKQSFLFCFNKSYWTSQPTRIGYTLSKDVIDEENSDIEEVSNETKEKSAINIRSITKVFGNGNKRTIAVNSLSMSIYESQITAILGHNGAGKSTLINMLVGTIPPSSGSAHVYGYDILNPTDMNNLRSMFGVCLQQDILFDDLNAEEHLKFFGAMKGIRNEILNSEVNKLLSEVQLFDDRLTPSKSLSGGQKRKLCIAIALIGNPKIILLDEPTSGVDAYSRRQLWSLLQSYKKDRVIILTTHFMDEADVLSDRKAIITNGKLRCVGSSLFLKNRFGIGYHLTVDIKKGANVDFVNSLIESKISNAKLDRFTASEVFYILPRNETQHFPELFKALEDSITNKDSIIRSYGISMTTLEEVFIRIGEESENENHKKQYSTYDSDSIEIESFDSNSIVYEPTFIRSFVAFLYLRILIFIRNPMHILPIIVLPIIMIIASYFLMKTTQVNNPKPIPLLLNPTVYGNETAVLMFRNESKEGIDTFISLVKSLGVLPRNIENFSLSALSGSYMAANISSFANSSDKIEWNLLFNDTFYHSLPILQNLLTNVFSFFLNGSQKVIHTYNHPFPQVNEEESIYSFDGKVYTYVILMAIMLGSIPPSIAVEVIEDREVIKHCSIFFSPE
jgi:ATP-binding cassette subfamily A (ABC1) protein 5